MTYATGLQLTAALRHRGRLDSGSMMGTRCEDKEKSAGLSAVGTFGGLMDGLLRSGGMLLDKFDPLRRREDDVCDLFVWRACYSALGALSSLLSPLPGTGGTPPLTGGFTRSLPYHSLPTQPLVYSLSRRHIIIITTYVPDGRQQKRTL